MDKRSLIQDIKSDFDGASLLTVTEVAKYLGVCRQTARLFLRDVDHVAVGVEKKYLVAEIARKIYETRSIRR
jgi:predicted transcriptional regulator